MAPKQLLMMPSRLAIELQRDGWWLRSMMPWVRRNPMPESVTDRPGNAIEYVFMLTKKARYFWDATAVKRVQSAASFERFGNGKTPRTAPVKAGGSARKNDSFHAATPDAILPGGRSFRNSDLFYDSLEPPYGLICDADGTPIALDVNPAPFRESHFATFPPKLVEPLIRGATSERGCCAQCGKPWVRVIDCETRPNWQGDGQKHDGTYYRPNIGGGVGNDARARVDRGWSPSCKCGTTETRPATVLDPFAGAGTTLLVADRLQRDAIGIELNTAYTEMAMQRCRDDAPLFTSWPPAEDPADTRMADLFAEAAE